VGETLQQLGSAFHQKALEFEFRDDLLEAQRADRGLAQWEIDQVDHPETGLFVTRRGRDAKALLTLAPEEFKKARGKSWTALENDRQKEMFDELADQRELKLSQKISSFVAKEHEEYAIKEITAGIATRQAAAMANVGDMKRVAQEISEIRTLVNDEAELNHLGPEYVKLRTAVEIGKGHYGVLNRMLTLGMDLPAEKYFESFKEELFADQRTDIEAKLAVSSVDAYGAIAADEIWQGFGPKTDAEPVSIDRLLEKARKAFPTDAKKYKATADALKERTAAFNAGREQRQAGNESAVWRAVLEGATYEQIRHTPEFQATPGARQVFIKEAIADSLEQIRQRARGDSDWLWVQQQRSRTRREQAEDDATKAAYGTYLEVSKPQVLVQLSEDEIQNLLPDLGTTLTYRLIEERRKLDTPEKVFAASIDDDLFNTAAESAGLRPYAKPSERSELQNARLGNLKSHVLGIIARDQKARGRELTRDEKETLMLKEIDKKVMLGVDWGRDVSVPAGAVGTGAKAYVPGARIPEAFKGLLTSMANALGVKVTEDQLEEAYADELRNDPAAVFETLGLSGGNAKAIPPVERARIEAELRDTNAPVTETNILRLYLVRQFATMRRRWTR